MNEWAGPTVAVLLLAYAAVSARLRSTVVTQAMVFVACGLVVGNRVLDLVDADVANQYVRLLAEATLALLLFTDAVRIDLATLRREFALPVSLDPRSESRIEVQRGGKRNLSSLSFHHGMGMLRSA